MLRPIAAAAALVFAAPHAAAEQKGYVCRTATEVYAAHCVAAEPGAAGALSLEYCRATCVTHTLWGDVSEEQIGREQGACSFPEAGIVMGGADTVAYFGMQPGDTGVKGKSSISVKYEGATFWFSTQANKKLFEADPTKYMPAWGGFCGWGIAREGKNGNPSPAAEPAWPWNGVHMGPPCGPQDGWAIVDGKLYCSINKMFMNKFLKLGAQGVKDGNARWKNWYGELNAGPFNTGCYGPPQCPSVAKCVAGSVHFTNRTHAGPPSPPPPVRYHCDAATRACAEAAEGHATMAKCDAACAAPAPPAPPPGAYACVVQAGGRACQAVAAGFPGSYPTLAACTEACAA